MKNIFIILLSCISYISMAQEKDLATLTKVGDLATNFKFELAKD